MNTKQLRIAQKALLAAACKRVPWIHYGDHGDDVLRFVDIDAGNVHFKQASIGAFNARAACKRNVLTREEAEKLLGDMTLDELCQAENVLIEAARKKISHMKHAGSSSTLYAVVGDGGVDVFCVNACVVVCVRDALPLVEADELLAAAFGQQKTLAVA